MSMLSESNLISVAFEFAILINASSVTRLCKGHPRLRTLLLPACGDTKLTDKSVSSIVKYCPGIEHLSLAKWTKITDASMISLSTLTSLKDLNLSNCSGLTSAGVQSLLKIRGANLEALTLSSYNACMSDNSCTFCDTALVQSIGECCPNLREFAVQLSSKSKVTEAAFIALAQGCPLLEDLYVYYEALTDSFLFQLSERCPRLSKLKLWHGNYTDAGVIAVTTKCTRLVALELIDLAHITDKSLLSIAEHCKRLKTFVLRGNLSYTDDGLCTLFASCTQLTDAQLFNLSQMTERSVLALLQSCRGLSRLCLHAHVSFTEDIVGCLVTLHELQTLFLCDCVVSDSALESIAHTCPTIRNISLIGCWRVTERGLTALLARRKQLARVQITDIKLTLEAQAAYLARRTSHRRVRVQLDAGVFWV